MPCIVIEPAAIDWSAPETVFTEMSPLAEIAVAPVISMVSDGVEPEFVGAPNIGITGVTAEDATAEDSDSLPSLEPMANT